MKIYSLEVIFCENITVWDLSFSSCGGMPSQKKRCESAGA